MPVVGSRSVRPKVASFVRLFKKAGILVAFLDGRKEYGRAWLWRPGSALRVTTVPELTVGPRRQPQPASDRTQLHASHGRAPNREEDGQRRRDNAQYFAAVHDVQGAQAYVQPMYEGRLEEYNRALMASAVRGYSATGQSSSPRFHSEAPRATTLAYDSYDPSTCSGVQPVVRAHRVGSLAGTGGNALRR